MAEILRCALSGLSRRAKKRRVEFVALDGETLAVTTLLANQVGPIAKREVTSARLLDKQLKTA